MNRKAISSVIPCASPHSAEPARNSTSAPCRTILRPNRSPSFPYSGVTAVTASRYAVTTHDRCSSPPSSLTIVGSAVDTIVWSSDASSITSISPLTTRSTDRRSAGRSAIGSTTVLMKMKATAPDSSATLDAAHADHRPARRAPPHGPLLSTTSLIWRAGDRSPATRRPTVDERYGRARRAVPEVTHDVVLTTPPIAALSARQVQDACGDQPGVLCRRVYESTHDRTLAQVVDFVVGTPLTIVAIILAAAIVNRLARRAIRRGLRRLASGGLRERIGAARRRTPMSMLDTDTGEISVRSTQRVEALSTVLRSVASFAIWTVAAFMVLGEVGINLGPLIAGAGIIGVALGFGSQSLVRDFLSGIFILVEDQYGVGDTVELGEATGTVEVVSLRTTR